MPVPGLHPSSRSVSVESAEQLRELGLQGYGALEEEETLATRAGGPSMKEDADLNELLNLSPSIYDLTVQYSCLAVHRFGGKVGFPSLVTVLILEILNVSVQMSILLEVDKKIALPAKAHAASLYEMFTEKCYSDDSMMYSAEVKENFEQWDDDLAKHELCQFPLTSPNFILLMIGIWTFYLMHELKQTVYFWWHIASLPQPDEGKVSILSHSDSYIITHMGFGLKAWVTVIVFLPKMAIAVVLWHIGAGWLTATAGIDNLVLNSLALTFICEVDELIFRTCTSEVAKSCLEKTKLPLPSFKYTPTYWEPLETLGTCFGCIALASLYLHFLQDAIPDYRWDLTEVCRSYNEKGLFTLHHLAGA